VVAYGLSLVVLRAASNDDRLKAKVFADPIAHLRKSGPMATVSVLRPIDHFILPLMNQFMKKNVPNEAFGALFVPRLGDWIAGCVKQTSPDGDLHLAAPIGRRFGEREASRSGQAKRDMRLLETGGKVRRVPAGPVAIQVTGNIAMPKLCIVTRKSGKPSALYVLSGPRRAICHIQLRHDAISG
jgi:hypothetical protein